MVSNGGSEWLLSGLLTLPVLAASLLIAVASLSLLVWRWRTLSKVYKTALAAPCVMAFVLLFVLIGLALAFGGSPPTSASPIPN